MCLSKLSLWGCWRDQLKVIAQHGSSCMISVRGSGPLICGSAPAGSLHLCADNCSDLDAGLKPIWSGKCGLAWLDGWLAELRPHVEQKAVRDLAQGKAREEALRRGADAKQAEVDELQAQLTQVESQHRTATAGQEDAVGDLAAQRAILAQERESGRKVHPREKE